MSSKVLGFVIFITASLCSIALSKDPALAQSDDPRGVDYSTQLQKSQKSPELALGKPDAPVTVVEYTSLTCRHCAEFYREVIPKIISNYVNEGKVFLVLRDYPLDNMAAAGAIVVHCADKEKRYEVRSALFASQSIWAKPGSIEALYKTVANFGLSRDSFGECLSSEERLDRVSSDRNFATEHLDVSGTPTVFVNGKMMVKGVMQDAFMKDGIVMKGSPPSGRGVKLIPINDNSFESISREIEALLD